MSFWALAAQAAPAVFDHLDKAQEQRTSVANTITAQTARPQPVAPPAPSAGQRSDGLGQVFAQGGSSGGLGGFGEGGRFFGPDATFDAFTGQQRGGSEYYGDGTESQSAGGKKQPSSFMKMLPDLVQGAGNAMDAKRREDFEIARMMRSVPGPSISSPAPSGGPGLYALAQLLNASAGRGF